MDGRRMAWRGRAWRYVPAVALVAALLAGMTGAAPVPPWARVFSMTHENAIVGFLTGANPANHAW